MTSWTFTALPPNLPRAARFDDDVAEMVIFGLIPLLLQQGVQEADVWALLPLLLLLTPRR